MRQGELHHASARTVDRQDNQRELDASNSNPVRAMQVNPQWVTEAAHFEYDEHLHLVAKVKVGVSEVLRTAPIN